VCAIVALLIRQCDTFGERDGRQGAGRAGRAGAPPPRDVPTKTAMQRPSVTPQIETVGIRDRHR